MAKYSNEDDVRRAFPNFAKLKKECQDRGYGRQRLIPNFSKMRAADYNTLVEHFVHLQAGHGSSQQQQVESISAVTASPGADNAACAAVGAAKFSNEDDVRRAFPNFEKLKKECQDRGYGRQRLIPNFSKMTAADYNTLVEHFVHLQAGNRSSHECSSEMADDVDKFWKREWSDSLKKKCKEYSKMEGELRAITIKRLAVAGLDSENRVSDEDWNDTDLLAAISPYGDSTNYITKPILQRDAKQLGLTLNGSTTNKEIVKAILQHLLDVSQGIKPSPPHQLPRASLDLPEMERLRRDIFCHIFFESTEPLSQVLSPPRLVQEAKMFLQWAKLDTMAATSDTAELLINRQQWLTDLWNGFKKIQDEELEEGSKAMCPIRNYINGAKKFCACEAQNIQNCPRLLDSLSTHHTEATFPVYRDALIIAEDNNNDTQKDADGEVRRLWQHGTSFRTGTYFTRGYKLRLGDDGPLRMPQQEAIKKAEIYHAQLTGFDSKTASMMETWANLEIEAIKELRDIVFKAIRRTYFEGFTKEEKETLFCQIDSCIDRLVAAIDRKEAVSESIKSRKSLIVLPTGLGKTAVICSLPFVLPLNNSRRILVLAPNLTIAGDARTEQKDLNRKQVVEGLMKSFADVEKNFYKQRVPGVAHSLLPTEAELPCAMTLKNGQNKSRSMAELCQADVVVTNFHQLKDKRLVRDFPRDFFDAIIIDEGHHAKAQSYELIVDHFCTAQVVLLTATPFRSDRQTFDATLIHDTSIKECIENKYIKDIAYCPVPVNSFDLVNYGKSTTYSGWEAIKAVGSLRDTQDSALTSPEVRESIMFETMKCLRWLRKRSNYQHHAAIVQAANVEDAIETCKEWRLLQDLHPSKEKKFEIDFVVSDESSLTEEELAQGWHSSVKEAKEKLYKHKLDIIVHVGMLGEGFDHTPISVATILRPFRSIGSFNQFVGRAVRRNHDNKSALPEEQVAYIITHPALGISDAWGVFCEERQDEKDDKLNGGSKKGVEYEFRNLEMSMSVFDEGSGLADKIVRGEIEDGPQQSHGPMFMFRQHHKHKQDSGSPAHTAAGELSPPHVTTPVRRDTRTHSTPLGSAPALV